MRPIWRARQCRNARHEIRSAIKLEIRVGLRAWILCFVRGVAGLVARRKRARCAAAAFGNSGSKSRRRACKNSGSTFAASAKQSGHQ